MGHGLHPWCRCESAVVNACPVTGGWDANGTDAIGVKSGGTWYLRLSNRAGPVEITFDYGLATDLPVPYRDGKALLTDR